MDNSINIQFTSDLHLEYYDNNIDCKMWLNPSAPYLAILGDLGYHYHPNFRKFLGQVSKLYDKVFYVNGNHEYFVCKYRTLVNLEQVDKEIGAICDEFDNIYYLNNKEYFLTDEIVLLGTTLWSFIPNGKTELVRYYFNDYIYVYTTIDNGLIFNIKDTNSTSAYLNNVKWLSEKLELYKDKKIIVMSHYLPSYGMIDKSYQSKFMNHAFASELDYLMIKYDNIKYWLCGHTHKNKEIKINECSCITNPRGYKKNENRGYNKEKFISI